MRGMEHVRCGGWTVLLAIMTAVAAVSAAPPDHHADGDDAGRALRRSPIVTVFEQARDGVVNISSRRVVRVPVMRYRSRLDEIFNLGMETNLGSGVVIHEDGYIVTNAHVVSQATEVQVGFTNEKAVPARVIAVDPTHDLAILKVDLGRKLPHVPLGRSNDLMIGETAIAIGNPLGLGQTVTTGIVSATDRELRFNEDVVYSGLIQTDAAINPGNSGGPLLNVLGQVIGINTAIRGDAQNICFAIPVDELWDLLPEMLDIERRAQVRFGAKVGGLDARVADVTAGSPAAEAGLQAGDRIVKLDEHAIRDGIDYYARLAEVSAGTKVALAVERHGQTLTFDVPLKEIPAPNGRRLAANLLGLQLDVVSPELRRELRRALHLDVGLAVDGVVPGGPADRAEIQPGDLILSIKQHATPTPIEAGLVLENVQPGETVVLEMLRLRADPPFRCVVALRTREGV